MRRFLISLGLPLFVTLVSCKMNNSSAGPSGKSPPNPSTPVTAPSVPKTSARTRVAKVLPNQAPPALAFGQHLLAHLTEKAVVLWDMKRCAKSKRIPAQAPCGIGALADGSILFVEAPEPATVKITHLEKGGTRKTFPATLATSSSERCRVLANPNAANSFWLLTPDSTSSLYAARLALVDGELEITAILHPPAGVERTLLALQDGELLFVDGPRLKSPSAGGRTLALPPEVGTPIHLASGADKDHLYAATADGALHLLELRGTEAHSVSHIDAGARIYALDGAAGRVAALLVDDSESQALRFTLAVFGADGKELLRQELKWLPARPPVAPVSLRLSSSGQVAVGDAQRLAVWDATTQKSCIADGL